MEYLEKYFRLFDESRTSEKAREDLINIFTEDINFVLNGYKSTGIDQFKRFVDSINTNNLDLKHMYEGWNFIEETGRYETRWAVCGKTKDGTVYAHLGKDVVELDGNGKIKYIENIPDNSNLFNSYK
jgi:hypothetical protein